MGHHGANVFCVLLTLCSAMNLRAHTKMNMSLTAMLSSESSRSLMMFADQMMAIPEPDVNPRELLANVESTWICTQHVLLCHGKSCHQLFQQ
jgi:hypothetical protein